MLRAELDAIDLKILRELQSDGRMTNVELSERVGISAPPCLRRVRKLEEAGIIEGYHAQLRKATKTKRVKGEERNGVTMPGEGSKTRAVWDTAIEISAAEGRPALSQEVHAALEGSVEKPTISTQYNRWCKFYGVTKEQRKEVRDSLKPAEEAPDEE